MENEYAVVVVPLSAAEGGGYAAHVPDLPGCMSDGATAEEAIANVRDAILCWVDAANEFGKDVPAPGASIEKQRARDRALLEALRAALDCVEHQDGKIVKLEAKVATLISLISSQGPVGFSAASLNAIRPIEALCH